MVKIPFVARLFWKILPTVFALVVLTFWIAVKYFDYEMTNADYGGSFISGVIFSYLLHLWILPADAYPDYEDEYEDDDEWEDEEDDPEDDVAGKDHADDEKASEAPTDSTARDGAPSSP